MNSAHEFPMLYKRTNTGAQQEWSIWTLNNEIHTSWGQTDGAKQKTVDIVKSGKNVGKKNETSPEQQAVAEAQAQWEKKLKKGYVQDAGAAMKGEVDACIEGGISPMLAHRFDEQGHKIQYPAYAQPKLDGHRCIAVVRDGKCTLWSRTRKRITGVPHIEHAVEAVIDDRTAPLVVLDGELYVHPEAEDGVEIPLTKGAVATVDPEDVEAVSQHSWHLSGPGYAASRIGDRIQYMHRFLINAPEGWNVDHSDRNPLNNRRNNLRLCSQSQNSGNARLSKANTSGYKGVSLWNGKWQVKIRVNRKQLHVGVFDNIEDAAVAYDEAAKKHFGEFATSNLAFEDITSLIRSETPRLGHERIEYWVYDVAENEPYALRLNTLRTFFDELGDGTPIREVETIPVADEDQLMLAFETFTTEGYEGAMVRNANSLYENKRSYGLQKIKEFKDSEWMIIGVEEGRGKLAGHAIFVCQGTEPFRVKMKGETAQLKKYWDNPSLAITKYLTVKYQGLTKNGLPRFPVGVRIREDV